MARPAEGVVLALCDEYDPIGPWIANGFRARGIATILVSGAELASAWRFGHLIEDDATRLRVALDNSRAWTHASVRGVLNRLQLLPHPGGRRVSTADSDYARDEINAIALSWLAALAERVPFVGTPAPGGLCGIWRSPAEWTMLAHAAGLPTRSVRLGTLDGGDSGGRRVAHLVLKGEVFAAGRRPIATELGAGLVRLAGIAEADALGVSLDAAGIASGFDLVPDLRLAGADGIALLAKTLAGGRRAQS